tara:strand:- start:288 stop:1568 length:1281 start_codon:yes stop_codon:yes gene_type:complete
MSKIEVNTVDVASGSTLTIGSSGKTIALASGATNNINIKDVDWQAVVTSDTTMVSGRGYFVNTTGGAVTMTLPASPSAGDVIQVNDIRGTSASNNITVARNSSNIQGAASDQIIASANASITFVYSDATSGWKIINTTEDIPSHISATGGTATTSGDYKIHSFNSSSNFVVSSIGNQNTTLNYLVVAGGGGSTGANGNYRWGGGGGAGGYRTNHPSPDTGGLTVAVQTYPITVGAGGAVGPTSQPASGAQGGQSVFSTITSTGGGGGGYYSDAGAAGGSGGGGGGCGSGNGGGAGNTPPVSPSQGNAGGQGKPSAPEGGGGGGGASAVGADGDSNGGGNGGAGSANTITGSSVTYAGGGGGSNGRQDQGGGTSEAGGAGGGGAGGYANPNGSGANGTAGTANTGGGAGGANAVGGSGVVIIRYKYQ